MTNTNPPFLFPAIIVLLLASTLLLTSAAPSPPPSGRQPPRSPPQQLSPPRRSPRRVSPPRRSTPPPPSPPPPPPALGCSTEVIAFSPCLPYVSAPPNNITNLPSTQCCESFGSAFRNGEANCLCYLVRDPLMFGFPINTTKLYTLSSFCPMIDNVTIGNGTLQSLCSVSAALPPLRSTPGSGLSTPHNIDFGSSLPPVSLPTPKSDELAQPESSEPEPEPEHSQPSTLIVSFASDQLSMTHIWILTRTIIFCISMLFPL